LQYATEMRNVYEKAIITGGSTDVTELLRIVAICNFFLMEGITFWASRLSQRLRISIITCYIVTDQIEQARKSGR